MSLYIALDDVGLDWSVKEVARFKTHYNEGHGYKTVAKYLKRSQKEVIALAVDQLTIDQLKLFIGGV